MLKMPDDILDLSWNDFGRNAEKTIRNLANDSLFTDVTLLSDDYKRIKAHKVILSSSSNFFKQVLSETFTEQPLLFLKGICHSELQAIIKFIYIGITEIAQKDLGKLMKAAADLQIEGLQEEFKDVEDVENGLDNSFIHQQARTEQISEQLEDSDNDIQYLDSNIDEPNKKSKSYDQESDYSSKMPEFKVGDFEKNPDGSHSCDECEYKTKYSEHLKKHKLGKHLGVKFKCDQCDKVFSTKSNVQKHKRSKHEGKIHC